MNKQLNKANNPLANLLQKQEPDAVKADAAAGVEPTENPGRKKKPGRKKIKLEPQKSVCIDIPESVYADVEIAKKCYGDNLTRYINTLIKKDIEANFDTYKMINNSLDSLN